MGTKPGYIALFLSVIALSATVTLADSSGKMGGITYLIRDTGPQYLVALGDFDGLLSDQLLRLDKFKDRAKRMMALKSIRAFIYEDGVEGTRFFRRVCAGKKANSNPCIYGSKHDSQETIIKDIEAPVKLESNSKALNERYFIRYIEGVLGDRNIRVVDRKLMTGLEIHNGVARALSCTEIVALVTSASTSDSLVLDPDQIKSILHLDQSPGVRCSYIRVSLTSLFPAFRNFKTKRFI